MDLVSILIIAGPLAVVYFWYVSIVTKNNAVKEAFSGIDVQLKKRTDLIPNILKIANKFMTHEKELLEEVTRLRADVLKASQGNAAVNSEERFKLEGMLENKMSGLMVSVENYPDLKSQENMVEAQRVFADVEEHISASRRNYNSALTALKNSVEIFPGNLIAKMVKVDMPAYFEIPEIERKAVNADDFLN
ncbi:MAG TPA: LemA family protein [Alphaproteobacteria bacterium]|nr:LemA family protein [Alphaproteobacteria bacterium]